jgi:cytosine/adenosine deaminase-related metal-dependent hydrolase
MTNAQIVIRDGRIVQLNQQAAGSSDYVLSDSVLMPGLINAHTHLEFSDLDRPIEAGEDFPEWISKVVRHRMQMVADLSPAEWLTRRRSAVARGMLEAGLTGTALLVDTVTHPWTPEWLESDHLRETFRDLAEATGGVLSTQHSDDLKDFRRDNNQLLPRAIPQVIALPEILGMESGRFQQSVTWAETVFARAKELQDSAYLVEMGFSPHSPYTLPCSETFPCLRRFPDHALASMHVAESRDELQWLSSAEGPFRKVFESMQFSDFSHRMSIDQAIEWLCDRRRSLLVHGNYLQPSQLDRLSKASVAIVYCPRTHQHFGHDAYPLSEIRQRQIPLLLGTDSRASSPDLNLWRECQAAHQRHPDWKVPDILDAVTKTAAAVLGVGDKLGSLECGRLAWLNVMACPPEASPNNLLELLMSSPNSDHPRPLCLPGFKEH